MTYREDGSSAWRVTTNFAAANQTALTNAQQDTLNGDLTQAGEYVELITAANTFSGLLFNLARVANIEKILVAFRYATVTGTPTTTFLVEVSANSTDGNDGAWTTIFTESHTIRAANSDSRVFINVQTPDESTVTYTWIRISWSGSASLNNLRVHALWIYADYSSPPYEFYDTQNLARVIAGETFLGAYAGNARVQRAIRYKIRNTETSSRTYTLTFAKVKSVADATFAANVGLNTDGSFTLNTSVTITVAGGDAGDFYIAIDIPANGQTNGNPQDAQVHYGKITVTATGVVDLLGLVFALYYDTLANIEILRGLGLISICLVCQRDDTDEGPIMAWSWWDAYGVTSFMEQENVGNDIVLLVDSTGSVWEMDRNELDNEEFTPAPILMVIRTVEMPSRANPHIWRRSLWFDFDLEGADGGILADYILHSMKDTGKATKSQNNVQLANAGMRISEIDVGHRFQHELRVFSGGKLSIVNLSCSWQDLTERGRFAYIP